jgi:hypothetical protein
MAGWRSRWQRRSSLCALAGWAKAPAQSSTRMKDSRAPCPPRGARLAPMLMVGTARRLALPSRKALLAPLPTLRATSRFRYEGKKLVHTISPFQGLEHSNIEPQHYAARANSSSTDFSKASAFCTLGRCCMRAKCAAQFAKPAGSTSSCVPRRTHQKKCASAAVK